MVSEVDMVVIGVLEVVVLSDMLLVLACFGRSRGHGGRGGITLRQ